MFCWCGEWFICSWFLWRNPLYATSLGRAMKPTCTPFHDGSLGSSRDEVPTRPFRPKSWWNLAHTILGFTSWAILYLCPGYLINAHYRVPVHLHLDRHGDGTAAAETQRSKSAATAAPAQFVD